MDSLTDSRLALLRELEPPVFEERGKVVRIDRLEWALKHRRRLWPDVLLDFEERPFLRELYKDGARRIVVKKSAQEGASEWAVTDCFYGADELDANVLYLLPTVQDVREFSTARVDLAIEASPYIAGLLEKDTSRYFGRRKRSDTKSLKRVGNRFLYFRHANVDKKGRAHQLKVAAVDLLIVDERDEMDPKAIPIAEKRLNASRLKLVRIISTPTYPGFGIDSDWLKSDMRRWMVKCPACKRWQPLDAFKNLILELDDLGRPVGWMHAKGNPDDPFVGCSRCGKPLGDAIASGKWVAQNKDSAIHGYHLVGIMRMAVDLMALIRTGMTLNETERREWYNQDLGATYMSKSSGFEGALDGALTEYRMRSKDRGPSAMGVDVGNQLHVVIRKWRRVLDGEGLPTGAFKRRALWIGKVKDWKDLDPLVERYNVRQCVVDALPEKRNAMQFAADWDGRVHVAFYIDTRIGMKRDKAVIVKASEKYVVDLDRTRTIDETWAAYLSGEMEDPARLESIEPDYAKHFEAMHRIVEDDARGNPVSRWINTGPDHYGHANNYCHVAMDLLGSFAAGESTAVAGKRPTEIKPTKEVPVRGRGRKSSWQ